MQLFNGSQQPKPLNYTQYLASLPTMNSVPIVAEGLRGA